jgi:alkylation response protein AidB-like acyl-CoA dehydrogenase
MTLPAVENCPASDTLRARTVLPNGQREHAILLPSDAELADLSHRFAAQAAALDRSGKFPFENLKLLGDHGLIGAVVPAAAGGAGANLAQARRIVAAIARGEASTALVLTMSYVVHRALARPESRWAPDVRDAVWRPAVAEGALVNNLRVEPELGSPARGGLPATIARRTTGGWRLSGHKLYATGIPALRWLCVWARTDEPEPRVGVFLVEREKAAADRGLQVIESWDHLGLRASGSHEVIFNEVALPAEHAVDIRPPSQWASRPDPDQNAWMIGLLGSLYDSVANAARDWLIDFLEERRPSGLGAPLSSVPRIQQTVGEIEALLLTNQVLLDDLVRRTDAGSPPGTSEAGLVKFTVTGNAIRAVQLALELTGNHGLSRHNPLERHLRDVLCSRVHTPQNDSVLLAAGQDAFAARREPTGLGFGAQPGIPYWGSRK